ncbi:hypothetical protein Tco_0982641 [Tanacetum coccineum]
MSTSVSESIFCSVCLVGVEVLEWSASYVSAIVSFAFEKVRSASDMCWGFVRTSSVMQVCSKYIWDVCNFPVMAASIPILCSRSPAIISVMSAFVSVMAASFFSVAARSDLV